MKSSDVYDDQPANEPCPVCKTDRYLNPNMTLLVNLSCFHKMCESCINRTFAAGSAPCPQCKTPLRKSDFIKSRYENVLVEKECRIRKRVAKVYNKRLEDFDGDLKRYNDFLEEVEDVVFNLLAEVNVDEANHQIEQYAKANAKLIQHNAEKLQQEQMKIKQILADEHRDYKFRKELDNHAIEKEHAEKLRKRKDIIDQLAASSKSADAIITSMNDDGPDEKDAMELNAEEEYEEKRGPSLMDRLNQYQKGLLQLKESDKNVNPFADVLESSYIRNPTPFILPTYNDPSVRAFDAEQYKAGGFNPRMVYKKVLESFYMSINVSAK